MPSKKSSSQGSFDFAPPQGAPVAPMAERRADVAPNQPPPLEPSRPSAPPVLSVSDLVRGAARAIEARFGLVLVEGEISNFSAPRSGHLYFTLKDDTAQLPAVMFRSQAERLKFRPHDGLLVRARGRCSIFETQGKFQLYVDSLEPAGLGALQLAFEQLKQKLAQEGLFAVERKRPLPAWPRRIGLVTSPTGAAVRDILRIAERRGRFRFLLSPCQVQGECAPAELTRALLRVAPHVDVVIIGRGGGSAEDLAAFNDEGLARAIAACPVPVVSAVGHEVDFTIADFVADVRAPTPSGAAELVAPSFAALAQQLDDTHRRLCRAGQRAVAEGRQRIDLELGRAAQACRGQLARRRRHLEHEARRLVALHPRARLHRDRATLAALERRLAAVPAARLQRDRAELERLRQRMATRMHQLLGERRRHFAIAVGQLQAMSPLAVLERGYSLARAADGAVLTDAAQAHPGDPIEVTLARGALQCRVEATRPMAEKKQT